jgi:hypothetical protein
MDQPPKNLAYKSCPQLSFRRSEVLLGVTPFYAKDGSLQIAQSWAVKSISSKGLRGRGFSLFSGEPNSPYFSNQMCA